MDQYELRAPLHIAAEMGDEYLEVVNALVLCEETDLDIRSLSDSKSIDLLTMTTQKWRLFKDGKPNLNYVPLKEDNVKD